MRAIVIEEFGGPETLVYRDVPKPTPVAGEALIQVKAFGVKYVNKWVKGGLKPRGCHVESHTRTEQFFPPHQLEFETFANPCVSLL